MRHRPVWRCAGALERLQGLIDARINEDEGLIDARMNEDEDRRGASGPHRIVMVLRGSRDGLSTAVRWH